MPSRTAIVLANRGDPFFGALARLAFKGVKGIGRLIGGGKQAAGTAIAKIPPGGAISKVVTAGTAIAKSKTARVAVGVATTVGAAAVGARLGAPAGVAGALARSGDFLISPTGCPVAKIIEVSAHERLMPIDRFGRARRRVNVLNVKALSRATRRLVGFQKRARRVERSLSRLAPKRRGRSKSSKTRCDP